MNNLYGWCVYLTALLKRWWHCLTGMFSGHQMIDCYSERGKHMIVGCSCGRIFQKNTVSEAESLACDLMLDVILNRGKHQRTRY